MESITIGGLVAGLGLLVALIQGVKYLRINIKEWMTASLKESFDDLNKKMDALQNRMDDVDMGTCKNFLVARLAEVEKGSHLNEIERERFWEQYEHYCRIGGNSYIQRKVEELKAQGKL